LPRRFAPHREGFGRQRERRRISSRAVALPAHHPARGELRVGERFRKRQDRRDAAIDVGEARAPFAAGTRREDRGERVARACTIVAGRELQRDEIGTRERLA